MSTLAEEIAEDWKDFDGLEAATLQRQTAEGLDEISLSYTDDDGATQGAALFREVGRRDMLVFGLAGVTGAETICEVPASVVGTSGVREGNIIVDSDGTSWNVTACQLATLKTRWRCLCSRQET